MTNLSPAGKRAIARIKLEHRALARIIQAMQAWVVRAREQGASMEPGLFEAMLRYVEEVPDRLHHPREDQTLIPAVAALAEGRKIAAELDAEHARSGAMLGEVRGAFHSMTRGAPNALNQLSSAVDEFAEFYWAHMRKEEDELLAIAAEALSEAQWEEIDAAFSGNDDPLFGSLRASYRQLYEHIVALTPEPLKAYVASAAVR